MWRISTYRDSSVNRRAERRGRLIQCDEILPNDRRDPCNRKGSKGRAQEDEAREVAADDGPDAVQREDNVGRVQGGDGGGRDSAGRNGLQKICGQYHTLIML